MGKKEVEKKKEVNKRDDIEMNENVNIEETVEEYDGDVNNKNRNINKTQHETDVTTRDIENISKTMLKNEPLSSPTASAIVHR